ncbi:unannotated protein [freshwater metagenome]|uniref:Unannotated protein n=1 Tax=freshwater metagenome TaxID=449393 RepID=A0A6J7ESJ4_9ZZZZ|nr:hypothetical protein [Actinomycetota bacterium]
MTNDELMASACPLVRDLGWAFYFAPATLARGAELGLDPLQFYVMGRGGVLGDVEPSVVAAAFGYFNPATIAAGWTAGCAVLAPRVAGREYMQCAAQHGRATLAGVRGLDAFVAAADAINNAADPTGLALYAAVSAEPLADDTPARAMQLLAVLREFRGSAHLVALRAVGIDSKTAHFVKRPGDAAMFGWSDADAPEITAATHAQMDQAEAITDNIVAPAYGVLDESARELFVATLTAVQQALAS